MRPMAVATLLRAERGEAISCNTTSRLRIAQHRTSKRCMPKHEKTSNEKEKKRPPQLRLQAPLECAVSPFAICPLRRAVRRVEGGEVDAVCEPNHCYHHPLPLRALQPAALHRVEASSAICTLHSALCTVPYPRRDFGQLSPPACSGRHIVRRLTESSVLRTSTPSMGFFPIMLGVFRV